MNLKDTLLTSLTLGNNCVKYLSKIGKNQDFRLVIDHYINFSEFDFGECKIWCEIESRFVVNLADFKGLQIEYVDKRNQAKRAKYNIE